MQPKNWRCVHPDSELMMKWILHARLKQVIHQEIEIIRKKLQIRQNQERKKKEIMHLIANFAMT